MPTQYQTVVLDKSFLQGSTRDRVLDLAKHYRLAISDALFFELLTCEDKVRANCFSKFPPGENPIDVIDHIGTLMKREIDTFKCAGKPSAHKAKAAFAFNPEAASPGFRLNPNQQQMLEEEKINVRQQVNSFMERVLVNKETFPNVIFGNAQSRDECEKLIRNHDSVLKFYASLKPLYRRQLPPAKIISSKWALYRWLQIEVLASFDVYYRYQGVIPALEGNFYEKMEHDLLDAQLLMLGVLEGVFATRDNKLKKWWGLICPSGILIF